jgi:hypothetical protein
MDQQVNVVACQGVSDKSAVAFPYDFAVGMNPSDGRRPVLAGPRGAALRLVAAGYRL